MSRLFHFYRKVLLRTVGVVAIVFVVVSALLFVLILADQLLALHWGYPAWSILAALGFIAAGCIVAHYARAALRQLQ